MMVQACFIITAEFFKRNRKHVIPVSIDDDDDDDNFI